MLEEINEFKKLHDKKNSEISECQEIEQKIIEDYRKLCDKNFKSLKI